MEEEINIASIIIDAINSIITNLFTSIDLDLSSILDHIVFINSDILNDSYLSSIFGTSSSNGILLIANSLIFGFLLYYSIRLILSHLMITQVEHPSSFILKLLFFAVCMNSCIFLCERILFFANIFSSFIQDIGNELFHCSINFSSLFDKIHSIIQIEQNNFNLFSIDGILKSFLSFSFINLTFSYAIRYILTQVFILLSPFAFLSLCSQSTSFFFKSWIKSFFSLLLIQIFVAFILLIIFSIPFDPNNTLSKFLICGSMFTLLKLNSIVKDFIGGISTDISGTFSNLSYLIKS